MRHAYDHAVMWYQTISIHAPLTGCDHGSHAVFLYFQEISIHAPLTGCDIKDWTDSYVAENFNPRTPYGMRHKILNFGRFVINISIHAPLTGCDDNGCGLNVVYGISIHAPLTGCDGTDRWCLCIVHSFQSTHPLRDATVFPFLSCSRLQSISIHAPLTGCDPSISLIFCSASRYFNPRTPYGMRR